MTRHNVIVPTTRSSTITISNNANKNNKQRNPSSSLTTTTADNTSQCITPISEEDTIMMNFYKDEGEFNSFDHIATTLLEQQQKENNNHLQKVDGELNHVVDFNLLRLRRSNVLETVPRCDFCRRRFHSLGNLANHHQLYRH